MAGITLAQRDLAETRERLEAWFQRRVGDEAAVSELRVANRAAGWSSESLMFTSEVAGQTSEYVVRIPPAGGGIFREYDMGAQALTQELLHEYGIATPSPLLYESDRAWIGAKFLVMPRIVGHTPSDTSYAARGWLHDAGPVVQRRAHDSFLETLATLNRVPVGEAPWLERPGGVGNSAELAWWREYARILRTQVLLRTNGQADHFLTRAPILPAWTIDVVRS